MWQGFPKRMANASPRRNDAGEGIGGMVMLQRRLGRLEHRSSVVVFGAASLGRVDQAEADQSMRFALENGINHFDTAFSYGNAEVRMAPTLAGARERIFLATKTGERTRAKAKAQIHESLQRMGVDYVDLIQLHSVGSIDELDKCTAQGGALEALLQAKEEGIARAIGITGHGHLAPRTHLEALRRFPFDSVLTPLNYILHSRPGYRDDFEALVEETKRQDVALRVIKAIAKGPWGVDQQRTYSTWYEPFDQQTIIDACVTFALTQEGVHALASAGDIHLLPKVVDAAERFEEMSREEAVEILGRLSEYASPFGSPTSIA